MTLPGSFRQYFIDAQPSNSTLIQANRVIDRNGRAWASNKRLKKIAFITKVQGEPDPVIFHTLFEADKPCDPDQWSLSSWNCVLTGLQDNITVNKISATELFKRVRYAKRYSVHHLLEIQTEDTFVNLSPLNENENQEWDMDGMRNAIAIPPFMMEALLDCEEPTAPNLARNALNRMAEQMYEGAEIVLLSGEQDKLDSPDEPDSTLTSVQITERAEALQAAQRDLNTRYQRLAEDCGLGVVLLLLNFDDANAMDFENVVDYPSVAEAALAEIHGRITKKFKVTCNELSAHAPLPPPPRHPTGPVAEPASQVMLEPRQMGVIDEWNGVNRHQQQPNNNISANDIVRELLLSVRKTETKDKVSDRMCQAILIGASPDTIHQANELPTTGREILEGNEQDTNLALTRLFHRENHPYVKLSPAHNKCIRKGDWGWNKLMGADGLSIFRHQPWHAEIRLDEAMVLIQAKIDTNTDLTNDDITKVTKNDIYFPQKLVPTMRNLRSQQIILKAFFGANAHMVRKYDEFIKFLKTKEQQLEIMISIEKLFPTHLPVRVDNVVNKFINSVLLADCVEDVGWKCTDEFEEISKEIEYEKFATPNLPPWISEVVSKLKPDTTGPVDTGIPTSRDSRTSRNSKKRERSLDDMIKNPDVPARCQITYDEYTEVLANNKYKGEKPKNCIKWHTRGMCFTGCSAKATHQKLSKEDENEMFAFLVTNGLKK